MSHHPSLPAFLSNEELTEELWRIFKRFGSILSVKASRDVKGRPFGFVQFQVQIYSFAYALMHRMLRKPDKRRKGTYSLEKEKSE